MEYLEVVEAGKFWEADENDFFTLPQIAFALGIGRNKMCKVPVARMIIEKRACYRKGDILDWALSEDGKKTLNQLKNENTKIGRAIKARTKAYDRYYANDPQSYYRPSNSINETKQDKYNRLQHEWHDVRHRLFICYDDEELKKLIEIAWITREQFLKLRMGLPNGIELSNWWFAENLPAAKRGRIREIIKDYKDELVHLETYGRPSPSPYPIGFMGKEFNLTREIESMKQELVQLNAELDEIG